MIWSDYWGALGARQRAGFAGAAGFIVVLTIGMAIWLLRDPYVELAAGIDPEQLGSVAQELERAKLSYRVAEGSATIEVPRSQLGRARAAASGGPHSLPPSVGLELFKDVDFSSTDFAQKINYQRALQGELTRTIQSMAGVRSARVHVILADGGLFKRDASKASAAVTVALQPGSSLTGAQVRGIQRLVAASVPAIQVDDVVVLSETGSSLSRDAAGAGGDLSSAHLELKREVDRYLQGKLLGLLQDLTPAGVVSLSVDTTLDYRQLRVTLEEPVAARGGKGTEAAAGVLVRERQLQRAGVAAPSDKPGESPAAETTEWENEYKAGHRVEQTLSTPGSIKRISVAVAVQGAPQSLSVAALEQLVMHAVGIDRSRGDSVAVVLMPGASMPASALALALAPAGAPGPTAPPAAQASGQAGAVSVVHALAAAFVAVLVGALLWLRARASDRGREPASDVDIDSATRQVRQWLDEGVAGDRP